MVLPALNRVLYVLDGELTVTSDGRETRLARDSAWHGAAACTATAGAAGATALRYELIGAGPPAPAGPLEPVAHAAAGRVESALLLEHAIDLDPREPCLMRCDRVDFAPGGEALPHRHRGGGIRCLIAGRIEVKVGDEPARAIAPGQAWFESGREPVHAVAARDVPTSFIRVSILPRAIRGQSSIMYVDPAGAAASKPRQYTVFVDEPITLP
jgi:quercetin dioxygenase-like cupin family protein